MLERQNRRLMPPVLVANAVAVDPLVDVVTGVRAKTAPQGQVVCPVNDIDRVELEGACPDKML